MNPDDFFERMDATRLRRVGMKQEGDGIVPLSHAEAKAISESRNYILHHYDKEEARQRIIDNDKRRRLALGYQCPDCGTPVTQEGSRCKRCDGFIRAAKIHAKRRALKNEGSP